MIKYRKRPVIIEAFQITEITRQDNRDWPNWLNLAWNKHRGEPGSVFPTIRNTGDGTISIATLEGEMIVAFGDWIIRGIAGELYPCKPAIFEATYERIEND